jgi:aryl-alcohol dehydrogenase-like predicted oxidoreductase
VCAYRRHLQARARAVRRAPRDRARSRDQLLRHRRHVQPRRERGADRARLSAQSRSRDRRQQSWVLLACSAALQIPTLSSLQISISLLHTAIADSVMPAARARAVAVIARECLANGLLVKPESEVDLTFSELSPDAAIRRRDDLARLRQSAAERGVPLPRLALEYVTGLQGVSVSLVGASRLEQLEQTLHAYGARA